MVKSIEALEQTKLINMQFFRHVVFLVFIIQESVHSKRHSLESIHKFVVELRNNSDSMAEYVLRIQAIFCPDQPFCGALASVTRQDVMNTLPPTLTVDDNNTIPVDQLPALIGVCCLPCSCEDTCKDDNNCCLTKAFENKTMNIIETSSEKNDCIVSASNSYRQKDFYSKSYPSYFMTTKCFSDTVLSNKSKCGTPNPYDVADIIPATSLRSGRTYWNQHCAKCNNDTENIEFWNMTAIFRNDFVFYSSSYNTPYNMDKKEFYSQLLKRQEIIYIPPFQMSHRRCVQPELQRTCRKTRADIPEADHRFLYETCDMFTSPVVGGVMNKIAKRNIFCYICDEKTFVIPEKSECSLTAMKHPPGSMTGLLNYNKVAEKESSTSESGQCLCTEVYDKYQETCRPVYCPPGSFSSVCRCSELLETVSGMPVLLKLKVTPEPGSLHPSTDVPAAKFHKALQKAVQNFLGHVSVVIVASLRQNTSNSFQLYVAIIRSDFGYDTKQTMKPLLDHLYADVMLKVKSNRNRYSVGLGSKIMLRIINNQLVSAFDFQNQAELILEYSNMSYFGNYGMGIFQEFSNVLFCKQVQLDNSQFTERNGQIFINATPSVLIVSDFYRTAGKDVRVCLDQYLPSFGNSNGHKMFSLIVLCNAFLRL